MRRTAAEALLCVFCSAVLLAGCVAGDGDGLDANGRPLDESADAGAAGAESFAVIQNTVFTPHCTACHAGASAPLGLQLDAGKSYDKLVGVASIEVPELRRVNPGRPDTSYLVQKLEGTAAVGDRMPLGGTPLPAEAIGMIKRWIAAGAPLETAPPADPDAPFKVVSLVPGAQTLNTLPGTISATFSHDLDFASVVADSVTLSGSGGDGSFGDGNEVPITGAGVAVSPDNPRIAFLDLGGATVLDDTYQVILRGSGPAALRDVRGEILDGDDDDVPGGDYVSSFDVDTALQPAPGQSAWEVIQTNVLTPMCTVCHAGDSAPEGLRLDAANSYGMLVGVSSTEIPGLLRVAPGDPDNSYLVRKLEGTATVGQQMPRGGPPLPPATIEYIRGWIERGAEPVDSEPLPPPPPPAEELSAAWRSIQDKVFTPICTECHSGGDAPADLRLDENNSYGLLVNQESDEESHILRVSPGNPDASYLIHVLEGSAVDTPRMPFNRTPLPRATIDVVRAWIAAGANP